MALKLRLWAVGVGAVLALLMTAAVMLPSAQATSPAGSVSSSALSNAVIQPRDPNYAILCNSLARRFNLGNYQRTRTEPATGRKYRGGTSIVRYYQGGECHTIIRNGVILHGPHVRAFGSGS